MGKRKKISKTFSLIFSVFVIACLVLTASSYGLLPDSVPSWESVFGKESADNTDTTDTSDYDDINLGEKSAVHFVDCGQGDCEVIISNGIVTVIDSGPGKNANKTLEYIKNLGIKKIDNIVLTHAHEDHIGGAEEIINEFEIGKIYMSKPKSGTAPTTAVYTDLLEVISDKGLTVTTAKAGMTFNAGDFTMKIISPSKDYDDLNNQSVVIRAEYDEVSFLFTGDAEHEPNNDMIENYPTELKCTVLKAGHHGSKTSLSEKFLNAVDPSYAVISCETDNSYGHPHGVVLNLLEKADVSIYRTDTQGSIVMLTNGKSINVSVEKAAG